MERVIASYTCPLFLPIQEPLYLARVEMIHRYGLAGITSMLPMRNTNPQGEDEDG